MFSPRGGAFTLSLKEDATVSGKVQFPTESDLDENFSAT
jgi:hypothetical protein